MWHGKLNGAGTVHGLKSLDVTPRVTREIFAKDQMPSVVPVV
jgi:hypothetical protein